jgi:hypothetical protein
MRVERTVTEAIDTSQFTQSGLFMEILVTGCIGEQPRAQLPRNRPQLQ